MYELGAVEAAPHNGSAPYLNDREFLIKVVHFIRQHRSAMHEGLRTDGQTDIQTPNKEGNTQMS